MLALLENTEDNSRADQSMPQAPNGLEPVVILPRRPNYLILKFLVEWLTALVLVVATAPLVLFLAVLTKFTSHGPAFYAQTRLGKNGRPYKLYKLRTMIHNAEAMTGPVWAAKDDHRTTKLGSIMRRTHTDEFPQLWNVLRGEMSLIGPRPERPEIVTRLEHEIPGYRLRLLARPGITGLAQMLVPADDPNDKLLRGLRKKVAHDIYYVREANPMLDIRITLCTACYFFAQAIDSIRHHLIRSYRDPSDNHVAAEIAREPATGHHARTPHFAGVQPELRLVGDGDLTPQ